MSDNEFEEMYQKGDMVWVDPDGREWVPAHEYASLTEKVERLEDAERRAWEYARFFSGRAELLRLHIRVHLGLSQKDCIGWGEHEYRNALLESE